MVEVEGERKEADWKVVHLAESMRGFCWFIINVRYFCVLILVLRNSLSMFYGWTGEADMPNFNMVKLTDEHCIYKYMRHSNII